MIWLSRQVIRARSVSDGENATNGTNGGKSIEKHLEKIGEIFDTSAVSQHPLLNRRQNGDRD